jgi:cytochrome c553
MIKNIFFAVALATFALSASAADLAAGKAKAESQCAACHAQNGDWNKPLDASYPKLGGQHKDYLAHALHAYQSGDRTNPIMAGQVSSLSDQDIDNLVAYISSLKSDLYLKK